MEILILIMIALLGTLNLARFTPSEPSNAPIHWLKINVGDALNLKIHHVLVGTAKDFSEGLKLAVPRNMLEKRPNSVVAKVMLEEKYTTPDGYVTDEILILQSSAVNDLLTILIAKEKARKKADRWYVEDAEIDGTKSEYDSWQPETDTHMEIIVSHLPLNTAGSRTAYEVLEVEE